MNLPQAASGRPIAPALVEAAVAPDVPTKAWLDDLDFAVSFLTAHLRMLERIAAAVSDAVDDGADADDAALAVYDSSGYFDCLEKLRLEQFRREFSQLAWELDNVEVTS